MPSCDEIVAKLSPAERAIVAERMARIERALDRQQKFDALVAAALDRILNNAPRESVRELAKQIRKRIREIAAHA
jgi:ribosome-associated translation inhibitor RaiA